MSYKTAKSLKVAVIKGGCSLEREISLESGAAVAQALRMAGHRVTEVDLQANELPEIGDEIDCVFPVLHGTFGEDGQFQKLLEDAEVEFVGCGSFCSQLLMDKSMTATRAMAKDIKMPQGVLVESCESLVPDSLSFPLIVKPASQGSSYGLSLVKSEDEWFPALEKVFSADSLAVVQEFVQGIEIAVGVVEGVALPVVEIIPPGELFDLDAKYEHKLGDTEYNCPPKYLNSEIQTQAQEIAVRCFEVFGCRDMTRMDFIIRDSEIFFIEGNTIPGFTASSLLPKSAAVAGISFPELCDRLIQAAHKRKGSC